MSELEGERVLVTGSAAGIGEASWITGGHDVLDGGLTASLV
ncbi:hypothetical protein ACL02T_16830 [Pseudonocardia sp. RS010]